MERIRARARDHVENVSCDLAKFRREAVGNGLHFADIAVRDGKEAKAVAIGFRVHRAIELIAHAIGKSVGIEKSRNTQFGIGMTADAGLKQDEVVGIARGERQIVGLFEGDGTARAHAGGIDDWRAAVDFHGGRDGAYPELTIDCGFRSSVEDDARVALRVEAFLLDGNRIRAERQVRENIIAVIARLRRSRQARERVFDGDLRLRNRRIRLIDYAPANGAIEIGGPEQFRLDELVRRVLAAFQDSREVISDSNGRYYGIQLSERSLVPEKDARLGETRFEDWLIPAAKQASKAGLQA